MSVLLFLQYQEIHLFFKLKFNCIISGLSLSALQPLPWLLFVPSKIHGLLFLNSSYFFI